VGGPKFFLDAPWPRPPPILVQNVVFFGKLVPKQSCVPNLKLLASMVAEIRRGPIFSDGNLGANGVKGSKFLVENVIFGIADPDLPIHYATFMGLR